MTGHDPQRWATLARGKAGLVVCCALALVAIVTGLLMISRGDYYVSRIPVAVVFAVVAILGVCALRLVWRARPESVPAHFAVVYCTLGLVVLFAIPPFSTPDSYEQFLRSYEIAHGGLVTAVDALGESGDPGVNASDARAELDAGLMPLGYDRWVEMREVLSTWDATVDPMVREPYTYTTMSTYSPLSFAPAALGILVAGLFTRSVWVMAYAARLFTLVFAGVVLYKAIDLMPVGKRLLALTALLPLCVELYPSMSPDVMVIVLICALLAYAMSLRARPRRPRLIPLFLMVGGLALVKIVYLPVCLVVLLIPQACFGSRRSWAVTIAGLLLVALALNLGWLGIASRYLIEYNEGVNSQDQLRHMLESPLGFVAVVALTVVQGLPGWIAAVFGHALNWMDVTPPNALVAILALLYVTLALVVPWVEAWRLRRHAPPDKSSVASADRPDDAGRLPETSHAGALDMRARMVLLLAALAVVALTFVSLYVQWTPVGSPVIEGVQGRYFIPLMPLLLLAVYPSCERREADGNMPCPCWVACYLVLLLILLAPLEAAW